jgi:LPS sulfotransferase NodH/Flp pilus assembly protein TadD
VTPTRPVRAARQRIVSRSYLVCTGNRSGSTLLCSGLWRTRIAGNPTEYFAIRHRQLQEDKFTEQGIEGPNFFARVLQAGTTRNGVFGSKVQRMQYPHLMQAVEEYMPETGLPPPALLARALPDLRYIWLWRRDSLARGISAVKAAETGLWHMQDGDQATADATAPVPEFDFGRVNRAIRTHNRFDREWRRFFVEHRIQPLEIVYEDFVADYEGTLRRILRFLDLPDDVDIPPPQLTKLADAVSAEWTEKFLAIAKERNVDPDETSVARMRPLEGRIARIEFKPPPKPPLSEVPRPSMGISHMTEASAPATTETRKENGAAAPALTPQQERLREAAALHQQGKLADAEQICQSVLQQEPENPDALHHMGLLRLQQGKAEEAIGYIEHSLMKVPTQPAAFNHLAIALSALRRHELALASFTKALALKPDYPEAHNNIGAVLRTVGRNEEALVHYAQALALKPDYLDAHYNCAVILQLLNRHSEAKTHLERVLAGRPDHADAHFHLGISLAALNQRVKAMEHMQQALALRPEAPTPQPAAKAS